MFRAALLLTLALAFPAWGAPFATACLPADAQITACDFEDTTLGETARVPVEIDLARGCPESGYRVCKFDIQHWAPGSEHQCRMRSVHVATGDTSTWTTASLSRPATALAVLQIVAAQPPPPPPPETPVAAEITGTIQWVDASGSDVTVPSDAQVALIFSGAWIGTTSTFASASLAGSGAATVLTTTTGNADYKTTVGLAAVAISATGTRALSYAYSHAIEDGGAAVIVFLKGVTLGDVVRDVDSASSHFAGSDSVTLDTDPTDLALALSVSTSTPTTQTGFTSQSTYSYNGMFYRVSSMDTPGSPTSTHPFDADYGGNVFISIKAGSGGGSSTSLTVQDSAHAHTSENVGLSTEVGLTIANAAHAHTSENVGLSTEVGLTPADVTHAHTSENVGLSTEVGLAPTDVTHAHTSENVVLGVAGETTLAPADVAHGHTSENVVLISDVTLDIAHVNHAHTVDGISLSTEVLLAIDAAVHAHSADNVGLSTALLLQIADGLHAHTSDGVDLTLDAWLVVADAVHGHTAENVVLLVPGGENWPHPATVLAGIAYGPTGTEYVGTMQLLTAAQVWAHVIEAGMSAEQMQRVQFAAIAGKSEGVGTDTETYFGRDGETPRLVVTFDSFGNRETVAVNGS